MTQNCFFPSWLAWANNYFCQVIFKILWGKLKYSTGNIIASSQETPNLLSGSLAIIPIVFWGLKRVRLKVFGKRLCLLGTNTLMRVEKKHVLWDHLRQNSKWKPNWTNEPNEDMSGESWNLFGVSWDHREDFKWYLNCLSNIDEKFFSKALVDPVRNRRVGDYRESSESV